jgi:hypothetical protein
MLLNSPPTAFLLVQARGMKGSLLENVLAVVMNICWFLDRKVICTGNKW